MSDTTLKVIEAATGGTELGAVSAMQGATPVKIGKQTIVDQTGAEVPFAKDASVLSTNTLLGTGGGTTAPPNGTGVIGWLRGIYDKLVAGIAVTGTQTDALTNTQLRASAVPVSGTVISNQGAAGAQAWPVSGPLTNTELRSSAVPVSGPLTNTELRASSVPVSLTGQGASEANPIFAFERPADRKAKQVSAANAAQTVTLPAAGAGLFHYIVGLHIARYNSTATAVAGAAANLAVTTANLGGIEFRRGNAVPSGGGDDFVNWMPSNPIKADAANTNTTISVPALGAGIVSVVNVIYFVAP